MPDVAQGSDEQRRPFRQLGRAQCRRLARKRSDRRHAVGGDAREPGDPIDIDDQGGPREPHVEQRHERLPACEHDGVVAVGGERSDGLLD